MCDSRQPINGADSGWPAPTVSEPSMDRLRDEVFGDELAETTDGCEVEPDGVCEHGHPAWQRVLGIV